MKTIDIITTDGSKKGSATLKKSSAPSSVLVSNVVLANLSNKRRAIAHTKTKGEVRGGGKKPWRQKGTGRARAGSSRSPLWIGGGVTFGPRKEASFYKRINKKQKLIVLNSILEKKTEEGNLKIVDSMSIESGKTKDMLKILSSLGVDNKVLLVLDNNTASSEEGNKIYVAGRNIGFLKIIGLDKLSSFMALKYKWLVMTKKAFEILNDKFSEEKESSFEASVPVEKRRENKKKEIVAKKKVAKKSEK